MKHFSIEWRKCKDCACEPEIKFNSDSKERYDFKPDWIIRCPKCGKTYYGKNLKDLAAWWNGLNKKRKSGGDYS